MAKEEIIPEGEKGAIGCVKGCSRWSKRKTGVSSDGATPSLLSTLTSSFSRVVRSETSLEWVEEYRAGRGSGPVNTDNSVVKSGCEEKEGSRPVPGEGCGFIQEFCFLGLSGSPRACVFAKGITW